MVSDCPYRFFFSVRPTLSNCFPSVVRFVRIIFGLLLDNAFLDKLSSRRAVPMSFNNNTVVVLDSSQLRSRIFSCKGRHNFLWLYEIHFNYLCFLLFFLYCAWHTIYTSVGNGSISSNISFCNPYSTSLRGTDLTCKSGKDRNIY